MPIPESQLKTWAHQGAVATAKATHESIRNALTASNSPIQNKNFEIYLQGSYKNSTNIRGNSDVDIVVQLNSTFQGNTASLADGEKRLYEAAYGDATYSWQNIRAGVLRALRAYYGTGVVSEGNKSLKVAAGSNRLPADVVVCLQYRKYRRFRSIIDQKYGEGIVFYTIRENRRVINFPKVHYENGVGKNSSSSTNGWYKPTVRIFKNARTYLIDHDVISEDLAPSYFLECLIYNVPDEKFGSNYQDTFRNVVNWLVGADF
ncbi:nucleotidyltransferase, partial [bacterium]|nr:nucleotidyltransferase [bacterium]